jgi:hypothetical protein
VVLIIIIALAAYALRGTSSSSWPAYGTPGAGTATNMDTAALPSGTSTSDASLNADLQAVDSQMAGFDSDSAAASQSVSDEQSASAQ